MTDEEIPFCLFTQTGKCHHTPQGSIPYAPENIVPIKELSQLDAEAVFSQTSPYRSTVERLKTAKKSHKMKKSADSFGGFQLI